MITKVFMVSMIITLTAIAIWTSILVSRIDQIMERLHKIESALNRLGNDLAYFNSDVNRDFKQLERTNENRHEEIRNKLNNLIRRRHEDIENEDGVMV